MLPSLSMPASLLLVGLLSCALFRVRSGAADPAAGALQTGDMLYQQRGSDPQKVDMAIDVWTASLTANPDHPGLLARLAEAWTTRAEVEPARQPADYDVARRYGLRCLLADPSVNAVVSASGALDGRAIRQASDPACLTWTALAWARWLDQHGVAGAAIDLVPVTELARRAVAVEPDFDQGRPHHALGLALALPPEPLQPDLAGAERELLAAMEAAPHRWMAGVDLVVQVYGRQDQRQDQRQAILEAILARTLDEGSPQTYVNRAAQRREGGAPEDRAPPRRAPPPGGPTPRGRGP